MRWFNNMRIFALALLMAGSLAAQTTYFNDSFPGSTLNATNWTAQNTGTGSIAVSSGLTVTGDGTAGHTAIVTATTYDRTTQDLAFSVTMSVASGCINGSWGIGFGTTPFANVSAGYGYVQRGGVVYRSPDNASVVQSPPVTGFGCANGVAFTMVLTIQKGQGATLTLNGVASAVMIGGNQDTGVFYISQEGASALTVSNATLIGTTISGPSAPTAVVASPRGTSSVLLQWSESCTAVDQMVRYKSGAGAYITVNHQATVFPGLTVTGLNNGTAYTFEVACADSTGVGTFSSTVTATPSSAAFAGYYGLHTMGQSLAAGYPQTALSTVTDPFGNFQLNAAGSALITLKNNPATLYEGTATEENYQPGMADWLSNTNSSVYVATTAEIGGTPYVSVPTVCGTGPGGLRQGTPAYAAGLGYVVNAILQTNAAAKNYVARALGILHGETDATTACATSATQYQADLTEWQQNLQTDIQARTGQVDSIPAFIYEVAARPNGSGAGGTIPSGPETAQYNLAKANLPSFCVVMPMYQLVYNDVYHLTNYSYRRMGEYFGKAIHQVVDLGNPCPNVRPLTVTRVGNVITVRFNVPTGPLAFDTTLVDSATNNGFEYFDNSASATISGTAIMADGLGVTITLNQTPAGTGQRLRYAYTAATPGNTGAHVSGSHRGNLRDSDSTSAYYTSGVGALGTVLYNWALDFDEPVLLGITPPVGGVVYQ